MLEQVERIVAEGDEAFLTERIGELVKQSSPVPSYKLERTFEAASSGERLMDLVERVGAYVGLAAFLGLAILALLYRRRATCGACASGPAVAPERATDVAATQQHYLPPTPIEQADQKKPRKPLRERIRRIHIPQFRYLALAAGGLVILAGAGFGAVQLLDEDQSSPSPNGVSKSASAGPRQQLECPGVSAPAALPWRS